MFSEFSFDIIPFIISIFVELVSPATLLALKERTEKKIDQEYEASNSDERKNLKKFFNKLNSFVVDGISTILGLIITLATAVSIPFLRARADLGFYLVIILAIYLFLVMLYFGTADPVQHVSRNVGPYSWFGIAAIATNIVFIYLLAVQWKLARLPL